MDFDPFDRAVPVPPDLRLPLAFDLLADDWPDEATSRLLRSAVHAADVARASIAAQATLPGAGAVTAAFGVVAWSPQPQEELCASGCTWTTGPARP